MEKPFDPERRDTEGDLALFTRLSGAHVIVAFRAPLGRGAAKTIFKPHWVYRREFLNL